MRHTTTNFVGTRNHHVTTAAAAIVFIAAWAFRFLTTGALENDHFVSLARAHQVLHGAWPVRDFFDPGQPLAYLTSAAAAVIAGPSLLTETMLATLMLAMAASLTYALARRASSSALIAVAAVGIELAAFPRLYNAAKLLIPLVAIWAGWRYADRPSPARLALLAAWTAVAFLWRHDFGVYIFAPTLVLLWYHHVDAGPIAKSRMGQYVALCGACLLPWLAYVQWAQGLGAYIASASRFVGVEAQRTGRPDHLAVVFIILAIPLIAIALARRVSSPLTFAQIAFAATMAVALDFVFLRDAIAARLPDVVALSVLLIAWMAGRLPRRLVRVAGAAVAVLAAVGVVVALARQGYGVPTPGGVVRRFQMVASNLKNAAPDAIPDRALLPIVRYLSACTPESERVLVSGFAPQIPVLARRAFAGGLPTWLEGYYEDQADVDRAAALLSRETVSLVVLLEGTDAFARAWPRIAGDLRARGFVERTWHLGDRPVVVWLPASRAQESPDCT